MYYPIFLNLSGACCLIVGAGRVGLRKLEGLLAHGVAEVLVLDPAEPSKELEAKLEDNRIVFKKRAFAPNDLDGRKLVFAATSNRTLNAEISSLCAEKEILCNCIDMPEAGSFIVPSIVEKGQITAAVSTWGASPALAKKLKPELSALLERYSGLAVLMGRLRPLILELENGCDHNAALFRTLASSELAEALASSNKKQCLKILHEILPAKLHPHSEELLNGLA